MSTKGYTQGYSSQPRGGNPRHTEAWALTEAARRIKEAQQQAGDNEALLREVRRNWRLWTIFQAELTSPECTVPTEVRHNMLSLCNFVDRRSVDIIVDPSARKADILISINREIAAGLFTSPPEATAAEPAVAAAQVDVKF